MEQQTDPAFPGDRAQKVARLMQLDKAAADVCRQLERVAGGAVLLKGPSFARWLYEDPLDRMYADVDVLAPPGDVAPRGMIELGFALTDVHPLAVHSSWNRPDDSVTIELHTSLVGVGSPPEQVWTVLSEATEGFEIAGSMIEVLDVKGRAFHACLHAAGHGDSHQALEDLRRACRLLSDQEWHDAAALASRVEATDAFVTGLRLVREGAAVALRCGFPQNSSVSVELRVRSASNAAQFWGLLDDAQGLRAKREVLRMMRSSSTTREGVTNIPGRADLLRTCWRGVRALPEWWKARRSLR